MSSNIPYELFMVIMSKVPAEALLRFRCVCKAWCRMIDDPYLINIHRDHQLRNIHDFSDVVGRLLMVSKDDHKFCSLSLNVFNSNNYGPKCSETARKISYPMKFRQSSFLSCNDLILVSHYHDHDHDVMHMLSIRNPLTQEVHVLPYDDGVKSLPYDFAYGFGYDSVSDDYKVLTGSFTYDGAKYTHPWSLYSLRSNSWKQINYDIFYKISNFVYPGVFSNGALHWIGKRKPATRKSPYVIVAFDLKTEGFRFYSLPASIFSRLEIRDIELGELGGCLSLSGHFDKVYFRTWSMNDYGDENSWTMSFSIAESESNCYLTRAISYSKNKGLVLLEKRRKKTRFVLFDLKNRTARNVSIPNGLNIDYSVGIFAASLVRINAGKNKRELSG